MVFYETFATYEAYSPAECAEKFLDVASNSALATLLTIGYHVRYLLGNIPYVGSILITVATLLLAPAKTGNYLDYNVGMLDAYFLCAIGEPGFTQELYDGDFSLKMEFISDLRSETEQLSAIPFYGLYKLVVNALEVKNVLDTFAG